jgi:RimJ/RimL family protein N-acetyltransferase
MTIELETERLRLRQLRESDHEALTRNHADPELTRFLGGPASPAESWKWLLSMLGHWSMRGFGYFAVDVKASGDLCGAVGLLRHFDWPETELGWRIFRTEQGHGYATEAAQCVRRYAYEALGLTTLVSYIKPENVASRRLAERLGARHETTIQLRDETAAVYRHPGPQSIT